MKELFELIVFPISVVNDPLMDNILTYIVYLVAFSIAWNTVKLMGIRGKMGSIIHWIVRIVVYITIIQIAKMILRIVSFIMTLTITQWIFIIFLLATICFIEQFIKRRHKKTT